MGHTIAADGGRRAFYTTTPIYYPSDNLHIGNAYCTVATDAIARYKRLRGYDVRFLTGTDEHGAKIAEVAKKEGVTPKAYVDKIVAGIKELWEVMDISNDRFIRTTDPAHELSVQRIFKKLYDKGDIYKGEYEGWYCVPCESYWTKTQLTSDGVCPDCGRPVQLMKEESYFFRLSKYQQALIDHIESHPEFILPESRRNEMINNFLKPGLDDLSVTRVSVGWGIRVPFDERHVIYVWMDALTNYITELGYGAGEAASREDQDLGSAADYLRYWPADIQVVGKEIVRFHTIIWPAILMALGEPLPKTVFGHGWLTHEGRKMSKSRGNVVDPVKLVEKFGVDAIRYFLLRDVTFGHDGDFSLKALVTRANSDLANDLGNLLSRTVAMAQKYFGGSVPAERENDGADDELRLTVSGACSLVEEAMEKLQFGVALQEIWRAVAKANKYIDETVPWTLARDESKRPRLAAVIYNLLESLRVFAILTQPFITRAPGVIFTQIGLDRSELPDLWNSAKEWGVYPAGAAVRPGSVMFPRVDFDEVAEHFRIPDGEEGSAS